MVIDTNCQLSLCIGVGAKSLCYHINVCKLLSSALSFNYCTCIYMLFHLFYTFEDETTNFSQAFSHYLLGSSYVMSK